MIGTPLHRFRNAVCAVRSAVQTDRLEIELSPFYFNLSFAVLWLLSVSLRNNFRSSVLVISQRSTEVHKDWVGTTLSPFAFGP
jgi:hypothetical protein